MQDLPKVSFEEWFRLIGKPGPTKESHGTEESVIENLTPIKLSNWRLEGGYLKADSNLGPYAHRVPTDLVMRGTGDDGLPILEKIVL